MITEILNRTFYNNRLLDYLIALGVILASIIGIKIFNRVCVKTADGYARKSATHIDDFIVLLFVKNVLPLLYFTVLYVALQVLELPAQADRSLRVIGVGFVTFTVIRVTVTVINFLFKNVLIKKEPEYAKQTMLKGIQPAVNIFVWVLGILFLLDNLGFEISTVLAGLGIGGVAVALASQTVLADLFCYFAILFDQPFVLGDFVIVGDYLGTIEHIGIKTTRIRSLGGEQLVFSNSDLTNSRLRNYKRMNSRRVLFQFGVTYQTPLEQLKEIPDIVKNIVQSVENTTFDRAHFYKYGDSSLIFEVVYYVLSSDYNVYMDTQQLINFALKDELEKRGVEFAYPTQTLYIQQTGFDGEKSA